MPTGTGHANVTSRAITSGQPFPLTLTLTRDRIHVVHLCLERPPTVAVDVLDASEQHRAARFLFDRDRRRFIATHVHLRTVLGRVLGQPARSLRFESSTHGKPHLVDAPIDARFNLSHSGERALIAIALRREVGVDIETTHWAETLELASRFFAPRETATLRALPSNQRQAAFLRCWTRKEAFIKATGDGLSFPLDRFEVSLADEYERQQLLSYNGEDDPLQRGRIVSLPTDAGYTAALAAEAGEWTVTHWAEPTEGPET
jgi:4'-phosphopantetheinyl transferase